MDWKNDPIPTISKIFDNLEQNIVNAREDQRIMVVYDESYHYIKWFGIKELGIYEFYKSIFRIISFKDLRGQEDEKMAILEELRAHKAAWESLGIDHYRYSDISQPSSVSPKPPSTYIIFPDREPERIITQAEERWYDGHYSSGRDWKNERILTISEIFDNTEYGIVNARENKVYVRYNEKYHYPEYHNMSMNGNKPGEVLAYFRITAFEDLRE